MKVFKKLTCLLLVLVMVISMIPAAFADNEKAGDICPTCAADSSIAEADKGTLRWQFDSESKTHKLVCSVNPAHTFGEAQKCSFGNWTADGAGKHSHTCSVCGGKETKDCTPAEGWSTETAGGQQYHYKPCKDCGQKLSRAACTVSEWDKHVEDTTYTHSGTCTTCGNPVTEPCEFTWTAVGDKDMGTCTKCGNTKLESCTSEKTKWTKVVGTNTHTGKCDHDVHTLTEPCDTNGEGGKCSKCGGTKLVTISRVDAPDAVSVTATTASEILKQIKANSALATVTGYYAQGETVQSVACPVEWSTVNTANRTVKGTVSAPAGYILADAAKEVTLDYTISQAPDFTVYPFSPNERTGEINKAVNLEVSTSKLTADEQKSFEFRYVWSVTKDNAAVSVGSNTSKSFRFTPTAAGVYKITCTVTCVSKTDSNVKSGPKSQTCTVTVGGVFQLTLTPEKKSGVSSYTYNVGDQITINAELKKKNSSGSYVSATTSDYSRVEWTLVSASGMSSSELAKNAEISSSYSYHSSSLKRVVYAKAAGSSTSGMSFTVKATVYDASGNKLAEQTTSSITLKPAAIASKDDVSYELNGDGVSFDADDFKAAITATFGRNSFVDSLDYVYFAKPTNGTIYTSTSYTTSSYVLSNNTRCYVSYRSGSATELDDLYFRPTKTGIGGSATYTAYNSDGNVIATGKVTIGSETGEIKYFTSSGGSVTFDEDDFEKFVDDYYSKSNAYLRYVTFDTDKVTYSKSGSSTRYGSLYVSSSRSADEITSRRDYKAYYGYSASSNRGAYDIDLDEVTFKTGTSTDTYTVKIPFKAYYARTSSGTPGTDDYVAGTVIVEVNDAKTIGMVGVDFDEIDAADLVKDAFDEDVEYVMFTLPLSTEGTLYYNFSSIVATNYGHLVSTRNEYYLKSGKSSNYELENIYFLPAADCPDTITLSYVAYDKNDKVLTENKGKGTIVLKVGKKNASSYFADVTSTQASWAADAVDFLYYFNMSKGGGKNASGRTVFKYNDNMTRAELVTMLYRFVGEPSVAGYTNSFTDVKDKSAYYYNAVLWASHEGVVKGTGNKFNPSGKVTREQIAAILWRYGGQKSSSKSLYSFTDYSKVSTYAETAMRWAVENGYVKGANGYLNPQGNATRAEVAVMLHRFLTRL